MKKAILSALAAVLFISGISAFDWPQTKIIQSDQFYSFFGQYRGDMISNSLIFSDPSEVKAADSGYISVIIGDFEDDNDFFPSALGNAVIITHPDNLLTVYGNLDSSTVPPETYELKEVEKGNIFGSSGNTAWQQGHSSLEFQVIDIKNNTAINPRLLMPRVGKELPLYFQEVYLMNKNGKKINIAEYNNLASGNYKVYKKRQTVAVPYKTTVLLNGTIVDRITYDLLRQNDNLICVTGKKSYQKSVLYPDSDLMLVGEVSLPPGKSSLQLILTDILGKEYPATYILTVY